MYSFNFSNTQEWPRIFVDSSLAVSPHIRLSSSKIPVTHQTPRVRAKVWCSGNNYKQFLAVYWYRNHFAFLTFWSIYLTDVKSSSFEIASRNQVHAWKDLSTFMSSRQSMFDCFCKQIFCPRRGRKFGVLMLMRPLSRLFCDSAKMNKWIVLCLQVWVYRKFDNHQVVSLNCQNAIDVFCYSCNQPIVTG